MAAVTLRIQDAEEENALGQHVVIVAETSDELSTDDIAEWSPAQRWAQALLDYAHDNGAIVGASWLE